ncbi:MAG: hypothetical protein IKC89_07480 [Lentisphaeria bacterium]|nr:hypothetical protein [Lentisphaeria bacterium]
MNGVNRCPAVSLQYFINSDMAPEQLRNHVRELAQAGYRCIFGHARQGLLTPYFSEKWWLGIDAIVDECRKQGIKFAIWDEDFYPSGSAGWRVGSENSQFFGQSLDFVRVRAAKGENVKVNWQPGERLIGCYWVENGKISDISKYVGTIVSDWTGRWCHNSGYSPVLKIGAPHWRSTVGNHHYALDFDAPADGEVIAVRGRRGGGSSVDFMNPEAVRAFINYTHEAYWKRYGKEVFQEVFCGSFMDEPHLVGLFPWNENMVAEYRKAFGGELMELLPHLAADIDENSREIRRRYRAIQHKMVCRNYLEQIRLWCEEHGIESAGHLTRSESLNASNRMWPNEYRAFKYLDLPCTDPLGAFMGVPDTASYHTGLKVVSSAAHFFNKKRAGSDALAVCGNETALRDFRYMCDYQMVLGITCFILHGAPQSWAGPRKDEVPPSLFYQNTEWEVMPELLAHIERSCERLERGKYAANVAVFYYGEEFSSIVNAGMDLEREKMVHELSEKLLSRHVEFEFIDGETLLEQNSDEFVKAFPFMVLQDESWYLPPGVEEYLKRYTSAGGKVIFSADWETLPAFEISGAGAENILHQRRIMDDGSCDIFLFNRSAVAFEGIVDGVKVAVPPRCGVFASDAAVSDDSVETEVAVLENWKVRFPENYAPLCCWQRPGKMQYVDLLNRCDVPERLDTPESFCCHFLCTGKLENVRLMIDPELAAAPYRITLNGVPLEDWKKERFYDDNNLSCDISSLLRSGSVVTRNELVVETCELKEFPYLAGCFKTEYRYGKKALPVISEGEETVALDALCDWNTLGYGCYSGKAHYQTEFTVAEAGFFRFDAGRVEDAMRVFADGKLCGTVLNPPYSVMLGELSPGKHQLEVEVFNAGGNRDKLAGQVSGMLGQAVLIKSLH